MDILQSLSDDQTALLGCFAALTAAGLVMFLSYYLGRWNQVVKVRVHRVPQGEDDQSRSNKAA